MRRHLPDLEAEVNACKLPAVWQSYDIDFVAPTFKDGKKTELGVITVEQNGIKIHDNVKLTKDVTTSGMATDPSTPGPIMLQTTGTRAIPQYLAGEGQGIRDSRRAAGALIRPRRPGVK